MMGDQIAEVGILLPVARMRVSLNVLKSVEYHRGSGLL